MSVRQIEGEQTVSTPANTDNNMPNENNIIDYLRKHPDFLLRHTDLLADLTLPHDTRGAASLIERQVAVLREQRQELKQRLQQLNQAARDNEQLLARIERLVLRLLEAPDRNTLIKHLQASLYEDFHADAATLKIFSNTTERELFDKLIEHGEPVSGFLAMPQKQFLFGQAAEEMLSGALIPLFDSSHASCFGVIGIGSIDRKRFHAQMATTFLSYLGAVVARLLQPSVRE